MVDVECPDCIHTTQMNTSVGAMSSAWNGLSGITEFKARISLNKDCTIMVKLIIIFTIITIILVKNDNSLLFSIVLIWEMYFYILSELCQHK